MDITITEYQDWQQNVLNSLTAYKVKLDNNEQARNLSNGFYIWDSKLIFNPELMFIGINPGDGDKNNDRSIKVQPADQMSFLEYLDGENSSYTLARETVEVLKKVGLDEERIRELLNERSVKTNFHYAITSKEAHLKKCFDLLEKNGLNKFWIQSYNWTGDLINILKPKTIICEGKGVFDAVKDFEDFTDFHWEENCGSFLRTDGIKVIGYSRIFSNITNKEGLAALLSKELTTMSL